MGSGIIEPAGEPKGQEVEIQEAPETPQAHAPKWRDWGHITGGRDNPDRPKGRDR